MSIAPFWTGLLLEEEIKHDTNSCAEYWMKIVKKDILQDKSRMRPGLFIRKLYANVTGRLREYENKMRNSGKPSTCIPKKKRTTDSVDCDIAEEKWGGKKKKQKGVYFKAPNTLPKPKTKKKGGK